MIWIVIASIAAVFFGALLWKRAQIAAAVEARFAREADPAARAETLRRIRQDFGGY